MKYPIIPLPEDEENTTRGGETNCFYAHTIFRQHPELRRVHVDKSIIAFTDPDLRKRWFWVTPAAPSEQIIAWDKGGPAPTAEFVLDTDDAFDVKPSGESRLKTTIGRKGRKTDTPTPIPTPRQQVQKLVKDLNVTAEVAQDLIAVADHNGSDYVLNGITVYPSQEQQQPRRPKISNRRRDYEAHLKEKAAT